MRLLFLLFPFFLDAQAVKPTESIYVQPCDTTNSYTGTYVGTTITPDYVGLSITSEIQVKFVLLSLQTNLNEYDPTFKARVGFCAGKDKLKFLVFMPMFNFSLREWKYNAPVSISLRYQSVILNTDFLVELGTEFYKDGLNPYLTISVPFK